MHYVRGNRRLNVVQQIPGERLRLLVVNADTAATSMLRSAFASVADAALEVTASAKTAIRLLSAEPYDLVAVDPAITTGGFALIKYIKDNYRWTETLIATHNQEPLYLREAISCGVDGLLFRPAGSAEFVEQALLLAREASARRRRQQKRVLAIGAHPDDVEIGCGGALAAHYDEYDLLHILTLSRGAAGGDTDIRATEAHNAAAMVGAQLKLEDLRDTDIDAGAETISIIEAAIHELQATHVYTHSNEDTHQDHRAVHAASLVAARGVPNVYCYQSPSSTMDFKPHRFVDITHYIDRKIDLIGAHKSQVESMESIQPDMILSTARYWGRYAGHVLAEPLQIVRERDSNSGSSRPRIRPAAILFTAEGDSEGGET
ncbi:LmbE family N-acetylglucosaminyl deacetylase [Pararhizobium capsulatum DSM 1112]|uniref:LmbE family N-acetylglucosaminyl deacetylase n=1 Tax=Pararhizobium capsulatum DSM 1112 TaxID=1121113 RepID=A0ABU0BZ23_9HYPH|nr:PIG-L family deacetylase [Pararhizobium capsulatum]MDQ0323518.1 LmbE family N-acetylglucosaminyl deacetylase [Pararhizobium capsulatum DSM 1112]